MNTKVLLIILFLPALLKGSNNIKFRNDQVGGMCFTTIDITVTEEWLNKDHEIIDFDTYPNIRSQGCLIDMFYSNAGMGKSQWAEMDTRGIYIQSPGTIYLDPSRYSEYGMQPGWLLRISILYPKVKLD